MANPKKKSTTVRTSAGARPRIPPYVILSGWVNPASLALGEIWVKGNAFPGLLVEIVQGHQPYPTLTYGDVAASVFAYCYTIERHFGGHKLDVVAHAHLARNASTRRAEIVLHEVTWYVSLEVRDFAQALKPRILRGEWPDGGTPPHQPLTVLAQFGSEHELMGTMD